MITTPIKKAARGFKTTTATASHNATYFIAACARPASATASFCAKPYVAVSYLAERWGMARYLPTLDDADRFLIQVGGAGHAF